jgi:hypothetical protein
MDNKDQRGGRDRDRVAGNEDYEVRYVAEKLGVSQEQVKEAIEKVGNKREDVEQYLKGKGGR